MGASGDIKIRKYKEADAESLAQIYYDTIHKICSKDYTKEQIEAWAPKSCLELTGQTDKWKKLPPIVAIIHNEIAGFAEFEDNGHIDCFYVHRNFQNQNIGSKLLEKLKKQQSRKGY